MEPAGYRIYREEELLWLIEIVSGVISSINQGSDLPNVSDAD
jgi:hypothetical protein